MNEPSSSNHPSVERMESLDSIDSSNVLTLEQVTHSESQIDLGAIIQEVNDSWDKLRSVVNILPDDNKAVSLESLQTFP